MTDVNVELAGVGIVDATIQLLLDCKEEGRKLGNQPPASIYMVPSLLRDLSPTSFNPLLVSIGPLHREDKNLQRFEPQKSCYLSYLLDRLCSPPELTLRACLRKVEASIENIRACYAGMNDYTDVELAKMMVIDSSFILEFFWPSSQHFDSVFGNKGVSHSIYRDLLLLENQIPFFVLQDIFDCTLKEINPAASLTTSLFHKLHFVYPFPKIKNNNVVNHHTTYHHHILGFLQKTFHPTPTYTMPETPPTSQIKYHSALELNKVGVNFKSNENGDWKMAMEFISPWFARFGCSWGKPTLRMPMLLIQDKTEDLLRNIIAYEQCTPGVRYYMTSYVVAMDNLIDTLDDVNMLVESGVLVNILGSNKEVANMINKIAKHVVIQEFYYNDQWQQLDEYMNGCWTRNIARLRGTYFSSPWSFIALVAAIILFGLTVVQTIFTIKAA